MSDRRAALRYGLGVLVAVVLLGLVYLATRGGPAHTVSAAVTEGDGAAAASSVPARGPHDPAVLAAVRGPGVWLVYLTDRPERLPAAAAPVVALADDGRLQVRRAPPLAAAPTAEPWLAAGVLLPGPVQGLGARQRAVLLDLLGALCGRRALRPGQVVIHTGGDPQAEAADLRQLLRWWR